MSAPENAVRPVGAPSTSRTRGATKVMPKKPRTTEGMPASTSMIGLRISRAQRGRDLAHEHRRGHPEGQGDDDGEQRDQERAEDQGQGAEDAEGGVPVGGEERRRAGPRRRPAPLPAGGRGR